MCMASRCCTAVAAGPHLGTLGAPLIGALMSGFKGEGKAANWEEEGVKEGGQVLCFSAQCGVKLAGWAGKKPPAMCYTPRCPAVRCVQRATAAFKPSSCSQMKAACLIIEGLQLPVKYASRLFRTMMV